MLASHALDEFEVIEFRLSMCTDAFVRKVPASGASDRYRPMKPVAAPNRSRKESGA